jgi:twitching motility protein PilU
VNLKASSPSADPTRAARGGGWRGDLLGTPLVQDYIRDGEIHKLKDVMKESVELGMQTFDQSLFELYQAGEISYEDALRFADSTNEVRLRIKLAQGGDASTLSQGLDGVEVAEAR